MNWNGEAKIHRLELKLSKDSDEVYNKYGVPLTIDYLVVMEKCEDSFLYKWIKKDELSEWI